jgi:beta-glucosidase
MVVPYILGVQQNGVAACVKHYALNNQELWRGHINVEVSDRALHEIYLPAFKAAVEEGKVWSIMGSYNQFRGQYCCHNDLLLNKILKRLNFDGVVITDWAVPRYKASRSTWFRYRNGNRYMV